MKDIQTHLDKIRSDAAECLLLSNLFTDGKGEVFARTAEHLNALALEVGKTIATNGADTARAGDREEAVATDIAAAHRQQAARPRRMLPWLLVIVLGVIVGAFFWANNPAKEYWSLSILQSKHETSPAPQDDTRQAIATLLSGEQAERKIWVEQLGVLAARVDNLVTALNNLETALDNLKTARAEIAGPSNKGSIGAEEKPPTAVTKPSAPEEKPVPKVESRTSTLESPPAKQSDRVPPATNRLPIEPVDRVGAIPVPPRRAELDPHKPTIGPSGCAQFRSFNPVSGTYVTLDGRRRQCR
ncbi:MAG: BA14K family protein [Bradyrhizobium sp.]|uniref:BA14K family protein n=1 Tax=Bradyrhizobium sp. TaxID=376 RepID=UPI003C798B7A